MPSRCMIRMKFNLGLESHIRNEFFVACGDELMEMKWLLKPDVRDPILKSPEWYSRTKSARADQEYSPSYWKSIELNTEKRINS
jgi:hypothetical protein